MKLDLKTKVVFAAVALLGVAFAVPTVVLYPATSDLAMHCCSRVSTILDLNAWQSALFVAAGTASYALLCVAAVMEACNPSQPA